MKYFRPFRFDSASGVLWRKEEPLALTRKAADLLRCFLERSGSPLTHQEIMRLVWPGTHVQPQNVKALVHELRSALGDRVRDSEFIRADPGRGYTFLAGVTEAPVPLLESSETQPGVAVVGRAAELAVLDEALIHTARSEPQTIVIEGERGTGKTALCQAFADAARRQMGVRMTLGAAADISGPEPYDELVDALNLLARQYPALVRSAVERHAPLWLRRGDWVDPPVIAIPSESIARPAQIVREVARVLDELAESVPLVICLEDLQWSDVATIDCIRMMAHQRTPTKLMIIATYCRSYEGSAVDALDRLGRDVTSDRGGLVLELDALTETDVATYIEGRFGQAVARTLARPITLATGANPRLLVGALETMIGLEFLRSTSLGWRLDVSSGALSRAIALTLIGGLESQLDQLGPADRRMLAAAASVGSKFSADTIAGVLDDDADEAFRHRLAVLSSRRVLIESVRPSGRSGVMGDGWYRFRHAVTADMLMARSPVAAGGPRAHRGFAARMRGA